MSPKRSITDDGKSAWEQKLKKIFREMLNYFMAANSYELAIVIRFKYLLFAMRTCMYKRLFTILHIPRIFYKLNYANKKSKIIILKNKSYSINLRKSNLKMLAILKLFN